MGLRSVGGMTDDAGWDGLFAGTGLQGEEELGDGQTLREGVRLNRAHRRTGAGCAFRNIIEYL